FAHEVRKASVTIPTIDKPRASLTAVISTVAGSGSFGFAGDGGRATSAQLNSPYGVAWDPKRNILYIADTLNNRIRSVDSRGTIRSLVAGPLNHPRGLAVNGDGLYIADTDNNVIRRLDLNRGGLRTVAGTGTAGYVNGVVGTAALLRRPAGITFDEKANLLIADTGNNVVRQLSAADNLLRTVAGTGKAGRSGDRGPGIQAQLSSPTAVAVRPNGDIVIADSGNNLIRVLEAAKSSGVVPTIDVEAGNGTPRFAYPMGSALSPEGRTLYVADTFNNVVRAIDLRTGTVSTAAGTAGQAGYGGDGHAAINALLSYPTAVAVDQAGDLFIADTYNGRIREVVGGTIHTVAGSGRLGFSGESGPATSADLYLPYGISVDTATPPNLFITDSFNHRIRKVAGNVITTVAGTGSQAFADGSAIAQAEFGRTWSTALDKTNLFVADYLN